MTNITITLDTLAAEANAFHDIACRKAGEALEAARLSGERLIEAKRRVGHGGWLPWVAANFRASARTATGYMRLAEGWTAIQSKSEAASDLTIAGALRLLAAPAPDDDATAIRAESWPSEPMTMIGYRPGEFVHLVPAAEHPGYAFLSHINITDGWIETGPRPLLWSALPQVLAVLAPGHALQWSPLDHGPWVRNAWERADSTDLVSAVFGKPMQHGTVPQGPRGRP